MTLELFMIQTINVLRTQMVTLSLRTPVVISSLMRMVEKLLHPLLMMVQHNLFHSGNKKLETTSAGINVTGHTETDTLNVSGVTTVKSLQVTTFSTFNGKTKHFDGKYANFGNGTDLQIVHDGSNSVIQNATGQFFIAHNASGGDLFLRANDHVVIRADGNDTVLTGQTGGIDLTGHTETDSLNVSGVSTLGTVTSW